MPLPTPLPNAIGTGLRPPLPRGATSPAPEQMLNDSDEKTSLSQRISELEGVLYDTRLRWIGQQEQGRMFAAISIGRVRNLGTRCDATQCFDISQCRRLCDRCYEQTSGMRSIVGSVRG